MSPGGCLGSQAERASNEPLCREDYSISVELLNPDCRSFSSTIWGLEALSGGHATPGHGPAKFGGKVLGVESRLFHDRRHQSVQFGAVLGCDRLGGDHQNRNASGLGPFGE